MLGKMIFRFLTPLLENWWRERILAYHEGLLARGQILPPQGPQIIRGSGEVIPFPATPNT